MALTTFITLQHLDQLQVKLTGEILETSGNFRELAPLDFKVLRVNCAGVTRINSMGVLSWMIFFQGLKQKGVQIVFEECSIPVVEQMNLISNFAHGGAIESVYAPFMCMSCRKEFSHLYQVGELKKEAQLVLTAKCPQCGSNQTAFDEILENYFDFLKTVRLEG